MKRFRSFPNFLSLSRSAKGNTLVEYALTMIFFFMVLFGIVDFARALYTYHFVSNAARQATRWAAVNGFTCDDDNSCNGTAPMNNGPAQIADIQNYVANLAPPGINSKNITTTPGWTAPTGSPTICATTINYPGCTVEVTVSYKFNFIAPIVWANSVTLSSTSEMVIAH